MDRLITKRIKLDEVNAAFERMRGGEGARNVVMLWPLQERLGCVAPETLRLHACDGERTRRCSGRNDA
ncbi:hypothetical protein ACWC9Q_35650 [Streptomyces sp. NPDC001142]